MKGQATVEFMVMFMLVLTFISLVTKPAVKETSDWALDVKDGVQVRIEAEKIARAIKSAAFSGENSKKTFWVFVPLSSYVECNENNKSISFGFNLRQKSSFCPDQNCFSVIMLSDLQGLNLDCSIGSETSPGITRIDGLSTPRALIGVIRVGSKVGVWREK